jgi:hypothetical protein
MQEINCNEIDVKKMRKHWAYQNRSLLAATLFDCSLRSKLKSDNTNPSSLLINVRVKKCSIRQQAKLSNLRSRIYGSGFSKSPILHDVQNHRSCGHWTRRFKSIAHCREDAQTPSNTKIGGHFLCDFLLKHCSNILGSSMSLVNLIQPIKAPYPFGLGVKWFRPCLLSEHHY